MQIGLYRCGVPAMGEKCWVKACDISIQKQGSGPAIQGEQSSSSKSYGDHFIYEKSRRGKGLAVTGFRGDKNKTISFPEQIWEYAGSGDCR